MVENSETMFSFAATAISFFFKTWENQLTFIQSQGRNEGGTIPRAPNHYGGAESLRAAPNDCAGAKKCKHCHKYFLQYSTFASLRPQIRTWGRQICFFFRALSNLVTALYGRVSSTCDKVWVSSPHWRSLLSMWLSKLLQLSPRSAASTWWEKLLHTSKTIWKTGPNSYGCFHSKTHQDALTRQCFSQ